MRPLLSGQTLNLMTLSGLALSIGILVDEATVEVENIHTQYEHTPSIARAARLGNHETMPGEYDRYNMKRMVSMTANIEGEDLGRVIGRLAGALKGAGTPPRGARVNVRGQVEPMRQMFGALGGGRWWEGLTIGLLMSIVVIFLLLTAYFQSPSSAD